VSGRVCRSGKCELGVELLEKVAMRNGGCWGGLRAGTGLAVARNWQVLVGRACSEILPAVQSSQAQ
jgi:hypothetical protein